jgi:hypothetical protein
MIGRLNDGTRIPGGPYTLTQAGVAAVAFLLAMITRGLWGSGNILVDLPVTLGVTWGATWIIGRIPTARRPLLNVAAGAFEAVVAPSAGTYRGRKFELRKPHLAGGRAPVLDIPAAGARTAAPAAPAPKPAPTATTTTPTPTPAAAPVPAPAAAPAVSGVERLLELARAK